DPHRRALPAARPHPAEAKGEDAAGAGGSGGRVGGAAAGAPAVRGRPVERSDLARPLGPDHRSGARDGDPAHRYLPPGVHSPWTGRPHVTSLGLNRLAPRQRAEMIAGVTGGKALPREIADQIIDRTDGVPLFVEELTKAVVESGMLTDLGDRY